MRARFFRSFSTELMKMAADIQDADIRDLLAERRGDEHHLPAGKLPTNSLADLLDSRIQKEATADTDSINISSGVYDLHAKKKKRNTFQKVRDYAAAGAKGAFVGLGSTEAHRKLMGHFDRPEGAMVPKMKNRFRLAASIGAGVSMAERAYRYNHLPDIGGEKKAMVQPNVARSFATPATALGAAQKTGGFKTTVVRSAIKPPKLVQTGRKFLGR